MVVLRGKLVVVGTRVEGTILHREEGSHEWARYFASITADLRHLQLFDPRIDDTSAAPPQKRLSLAQLGKPLGPGPGLIIQFSCGQRRHQMQLSHPEEARNWMAALEEAEQLQGTLQSQRAAPGTTFAGAMLTGVTAQPRHLEEMPAFIGPVDRLAAEDLLVEALPRFPGGTYVIRISPRDGKLVLSWLRASDKMGHVKISKNREGEYRFETTPRFAAHPTVLQLLMDTSVMRNVVGSLSPYSPPAQAVGTVAGSASQNMEADAEPLSPLPKNSMTRGHHAAPAPAPIDESLRPLSMALEDESEDESEDEQFLLQDGRGDAGQDAVVDDDFVDVNAAIASHATYLAQRGVQHGAAASLSVKPTESGYINDEVQGDVSIPQPGLNFPPPGTSTTDEEDGPLPRAPETHTPPPFQAVVDRQPRQHAAVPVQKPSMRPSLNERPSTFLPPHAGTMPTPRSFQETVLAGHADRVRTVSGTILVASAPPPVPNTPRPGHLAPPVPNTRRPSGGNAPPVPSTPRPSSISVSSRGGTLPPREGGTLAPPVPNTPRPNGSTVLHPELVDSTGTPTLGQGLQPQGAGTLKDNLQSIMSTTKYVLERRFQLQTYTSELGLMQSVRYLARDVIMEFPMPSIENRLGGISKYVLRDKAGNGLFMVYDPMGIASDMSKCMHDCCGKHEPLRLGIVNDNLDVIFRVEHSGACNTFCCFSRWCCLQPKLIVHMQDWEIGVITLPMFGSFFKPVYYIRDSGGVEIRVVGRPGIHHNVTLCFKIQEQRAGKWVDIGSIERRCTEDPLKKGAIEIEGFVISVPKELNMELRISVICCALYIDYALFSVRTRPTTSRDVLAPPPKDKGSCWPWLGMCSCFLCGCVCRC